MQMFYPDHYNGAFVACPDPVDFHAYMTADLYRQDNMFFLPGVNKQVEQPAMRDYLGHTLISMRDNIAYEAALALAGGLFASGRGRVSAADPRQNKRRDRPQNGRILACALRPECDPSARLGDPRAIEG